MPLPFLKPKQVAGLIISKRKADGTESPVEREDAPEQGLMACAEDLIRAVHAKDAQSVAAAMRAAYECLACEEDSMVDDSYDAQNAKVGE